MLLMAFLIPNLPEALLGRMLLLRKEVLGVLFGFFPCWAEES